MVNEIAEITSILKIADVVAFRHFPECFPNYPYVDRHGRPVAIAATESKASAKYKPIGKVGSIGAKPTAERIRNVYAGQLQLALDQIACNMEPILEAMIKSAIGAPVIRKDRDGNEIGVFEMKPDVKAAELLINRLLGKPTEYQDVQATTVVQAGKNVMITIPDNGTGQVAVEDQPRLFDGNVLGLDDIGAYPAKANLHLYPESVYAGLEDE